MLWVDKYRPKTVAQLSYHPSITSRLESLSVNPSSMPHLLFYGPSGSGKKTRITALLRSIYGPGVERLRLDRRTFTTPTKKTIDINMISSNYHIEMSPGDAGRNDRFVVQDIIKEMAQNKSLAASATNNAFVVNDSTTNNNTATNTNAGKKVEFKVVLLVEVDRLSRQAQAALRRTMEKYASTCRLILCCQNPSKVIEPVRSRCLGIRVPSPTTDDVVSCLRHVCRKESVTLPDALALDLAANSERNLRRALLLLESHHVKHRDAFALQVTAQATTPKTAVSKTDWEVYIATLAAEITREQSPQRLLAARERLYELLINCIPARVILRTLALELCKNVDDELKHDVVVWAAFYEHRISLGSKDIFHLEAFVAKYMALYKAYLNHLFA